MSAEHPGGTGQKHLCTEASLNLLVLDVHPRNQPTGVTDEWDLRTFHIESSGPGAGESAVNERTPTLPSLQGGRQSEPFPYSTAVVEGHPAVGVGARICHQEMHVGGSG